MVKLTEAFVLSQSKASNLQNVRKLNLWACELTDISVLRKAVSLTVATLSSNHISSLSDLAQCSNLEELYFRSNCVTSIAELANLQSLSRLRILWLEGNPCTTHPDYRLVVLRFLPQLERLDNIVVEKDEIALAAQVLLSEEIAGYRLNSKKSPSSIADTTGMPALPPPALLSPVLPPPSPSSVRIVASCGGVTDSCYQPCDGKSDISGQPTDTSTSVLPVAVLPVAVLPTSSTVTDRRLPTKLLPNKDSPATVTSEFIPQSSMANVLEAVLCLLSELEPENLEIVADAVRNRLNSL